VLHQPAVRWIGSGAAALPQQPFRSSGSVRPGAQDRASPNVMGLASLRLEIGICCDVLYSVLLLSVILGLDFLGRALSRPQVRCQNKSVEMTGSKC
jgi:hypothetical protein